MTMNEEAKCGREKMWDELDNDKQIERLRSVLRTLEIRSETFFTRLDRLESHLHKDDKIVVPISSDRYPIGGGFSRGSSLE